MRARKILSNVWLPIVVLSVIGIVGYGLNTIRHMSQEISYPAVTNSIHPTIIQINPKNVTYEVFGVLGEQGKVSYANLDSVAVEVVLTSLPWSHSETTMSPAATLGLVAQVDGNNLGCRILVNGEIRDEHVVSHEGAAVSCTVTAA